MCCDKGYKGEKTGFMERRSQGLKKAWELEGVEVLEQHKENPDTDMKLAHVIEWKEARLAGVQRLSQRVLVGDFGNVNWSLTLQGLAGHDK